MAFRGTLELTADSEVELNILGAAWYVVWLDGQYLTEGPPRFPLSHPEYQTRTVPLALGTHVIAVQVHQIGYATRMLNNPPPFLFCVAESNKHALPIRWKCSRLGGYVAEVQRINPQLGFMEWCDTRSVPLWQVPSYDDQPWPEPVEVHPDLGPFKPLSTADTQALVHKPKLIGSGELVETFGYERDNPAARFFMRDLSPQDLPPQGLWRRYDLQRVRLARPRFLLDLPEGAVVEFAYSEALCQGRVPPWITLSAGDSCNLDHYVARGGQQEFFPLTPKGGRFLEVHILAPPIRSSSSRKRSWNAATTAKWKGASGPTTSCSTESGRWESPRISLVPRIVWSTIRLANAANGLATSWVWGWTWPRWRFPICVCFAADYCNALNALARTAW